MAGDDRSMNGTGPELGIYIIVPALPNNGPNPEKVNKEVIIRFLDQPSFNETRAAKYQPESLLHAPESFNAYEGTEQRQFQIEGKFFCETDEDVITNNKILQVVRSLIMPDYNDTGAPPTPIRLYAYGSHNFKGVPCLVANYSMDWPNDVDYAVNGEITMPMVFTLGITMIEQHSIRSLRSFSLSDFRTGKMTGRGY